MRPTTELIGLGVCLALAVPMLAGNLIFRTQLFFEIRNHYLELARVGAYIDENTKEMVTSIALDYDDKQLLPGVSAHMFLISYREETEYSGYNHNFSINEIRSRINDSNFIRFLDPAISPEQWFSLIKRYDVGFILTPYDTSQLVSSFLGKSLEIAFSILFGLN